MGFKERWQLVIMVDIIGKCIRRKPPRRISEVLRMKNVIFNRLLCLVGPVSIRRMNFYDECEDSAELYWKVIKDFRGELRATGVEYLSEFS